MPALRATPPGAIPFGRSGIVFGRKACFYSERRPDGLPDDRIPEQKDQRKHDVHLARLEQFPIDIAEQLQQEMKELDCLSVRAFARQTGRDWSLVSRYQKILTLRRRSSTSSGTTPLRSGAGAP